MTAILLSVGRCFWFILPAYSANVAPIVAKRMKIMDSLAIPVDGGRMFLGQPLLGPNKTVRGFLLGTLAGIMTIILQALLFSFPLFRQLSFINYQETNFLLLGFLMGFGSLVGDAAGSFVKRRLGKKCGEPWLPGDQLSLIIGALFFSLPLFVPSLRALKIAAALVLLTFCFHIAATKIAYFLRIREEQW